MDIIAALVLLSSCALDRNALALDRTTALNHTPTPDHLGMDAQAHCRKTKT
jgi:hypothetical protein